MTIRPFHPQDAAALLTFWNRTVRFDQLTPDLLHEKVAADPQFTPDTTLLAEIDQTIVGFGMGVVRPSKDGPCGYIKLLAVAPAHRRQGIGGALLEKLEAQLTAQGATVLRVCESAPNYLTPGLDVRYTFGMLFFQKYGYTRFGETYNLDVDLQAHSFDTHAQEEALLTKGRIIRRATPEDRAGVMALLDAYWPPWKHEVATCYTHAPISLHIAISDTHVVGFSAYDANNIGTSWFGPMGTAPSERGLGIGGILLQRCLRDMRMQGHTRAIIPWVGPIGFYAHYAGATIDRVFYRYEKTPR